MLLNESVIICYSSVEPTINKAKEIIKELYPEYTYIGIERSQKIDVSSWRFEVLVKERNVIE